jgi:polysaccharide biosynthesis/export protein
MLTEMLMRNLCLAALLAVTSSSIVVAAQESTLIGPGDRLHVSIVDAPELDQHARVTDSGEIPVIGAGNVNVSNLTPGQAAQKVRSSLISAHYMNHPQVVLTVDQYAAQTVSVLGQVKTPGAYPIASSRSVLDAVAMAGGLTDSADRHITIKQRGVETPVEYDLSNNSSEAFSQQVLVHPGDTILVPKAGIAYVLGDVGRPGGFIMQNNHSSLTVLQAVAMAGGTARSAVPSKARLIRKAGDGFQEIPIQLSAIQKGRQPDVQLQPDDVLYIPFSYLRNMAVGGAGIAAAASAAAVYAIN